MYREGGPRPEFQGMSADGMAAVIREGLEREFQGFFSDPEHLDPAYFTDENLGELIHLLRRGLEMLDGSEDLRLAAAKGLDVRTIHECLRDLLKGAEGLLYQKITLPAKDVREKLATIQQLGETMYSTRYNDSPKESGPRPEFHTYRESGARPEPQELNVDTLAASISGEIELRFQEFFSDPDHLDPVHLSDENLDEFIHLLRKGLEMLKDPGPASIAASRELKVDAIRACSRELVEKAEALVSEGVLLPASNIEGKLKAIKELGEGIYQE